MKRVLLWIIGIAVTFTSCSREEVTADLLPHTDDFTASISVESRTELQDRTKILWEEDDLLSIFAVTMHNRQYRVKSLSENRRSATFTATGVYSGSGNNAPAAKVALFPYHVDARLNDLQITTYTPSEQPYASGKYGLDYSLMVAQTTGSSFSFKNTGSLMRFNVAKDEGVPEPYTLQSIRVESKTLALAGKVTIDLSTDNKAIVAEDGPKMITLTGINTKITTEAQSFYMALPAVTFPANDLTFTFVFDEMTKVIPYAASLTAGQNRIKSITYNISSEEFTGETPGFDTEE